jgi:hypothetical protein
MAPGISTGASGARKATSHLHRQSRGIQLLINSVGICYVLRRTIHSVNDGNRANKLLSLLRVAVHRVSGDLEASLSGGSRHSERR